MAHPKYKRVVLKLSGEALAGNLGYGIDQDMLSSIAEQDQEAANSLKYFDWLMYSLSGNKKENQDHIEKWILHKIINYKKATTSIVTGKQIGRAHV